MRRHLDLPINAAIACADGLCGHSVAIILNPVSDQVTHLIVREPGLLGSERMTPIEFVTESTPELIRLRCTRDELAQMPPFVSTDYLPPPPGLLPGYAAGVLLWPYVGMEQIGIDHEHIPPDELAVHRGAHVHATDGQIGVVEEFLVDPTDNGITHVILRGGYLWNRQDVTVPVSHIDHIDDDNVYLTLNKHQIAALPAIAVQRRVR